MTCGARCCTMLLLALSIAAAHAGPAPVEEGLRRCAGEGDERQRLACFDALVSALPQFKSDQFGMTGAIARQRDPAVVASAVREALHGTITGLRQSAGGQWVFTLDNSQQWIEAEARPGLHFKVGERVAIEHGALSALWLKADHHRQTRVKRIQ